jgi:hypothetical protein
VQYAKAKNLAIKFGFGIEYYLLKYLAVTIEPQYIFFPMSNVFWVDDYSNFGIKMGFTALLF